MLLYPLYTHEGTCLTKMGDRPQGVAGDCNSLHQSGSDRKTRANIRPRDIVRKQVTS